MKQRFSALAIASLAVAGLVLLLSAISLLAQTAAVAPGTSPAQWRAKFNLHANKMHKNIFPGVDLIYSGSPLRLNVQLIVQPGASLDAIRLDLTGAQQTQIGAEVQTQLPADKLAMRLLPLQMFQAAQGEKQTLEGSFVAREDGSVGIAVKAYNPKQPLIVTFAAAFQPIVQAEEAALSKGGAPTISTPPGPVITATKTDEVVPDANNDDAAFPGETIKYTVTVQNSGAAEATNTNYSDAVDPNTTFTPGTLKTTPLAYSQTLTILEDTATPITLTGKDADGGNLTFATTSSPTKGANGSITQSPPWSASLTYTPGANKNDNTAPAGADGFNFKVTDADANIDNASVTINITPVNDAPVFNCGANQTHNNTDGPAITVPAWATGIVAGPATATDETGQVLTFNLTGNTNPAIFSTNPAINPSNGNLTYTLSGVGGQSTISFTLSDGGGTANGGDDTSDPCSFTITVNSAPTAVADNYNTQPNTTISRSASDPDDLLDNDSRGFPLANLITFGGGTLGGSVTDHAAGATANVSGHSLTVNADGSFSYSPATGFTGNFTFNYRLTNVAGSSDATVTIAVQAAPVAVADNYFTPVNTTLSRSTSDPDDLLDNDNLGSPAATLTHFGGGSLGGSVTSNAAGASVALAGGTLTVNSDGSFTLATPTVTGSFTFQYRLTNVSGTSDATVTIEVRQAPSAVADNYNMLVNGTLTINTSDPNDLLDNDTRGFPLANVTSFGGGSLGGTVTSNAASASVPLAGGTLQVNSNGSFSLTTPTTTGSFTFDYRITNSSGSSDATVTIEVRKAPTAVNDGPYTVSTGNLLTINTSDPNDLLDNDDRGFPVVGISSFGGGNAGGTVTTYPAGTGVPFAGGTLQVNNNGSFSLTTPTVAGAYSFQYRLFNSAGFSDATVTIEVQGPPLAVNDPNGGLPSNSTPSNDGSPVGTDHPYHTALNTTLTVPDGANDLLANDNLGFPAGAIFSYGTTGNVTAQTTIGSPTPTNQGGSVTVQANGSFSYTPPSATFTGTDQFAYRLQNISGSSDATVTVAVGVRPAAVADARSATGNVRLSTATNLLSNDTGDQLTVTAFDASSAQGGNVTVAANGSFTYNPPPGYEGSDSFNYTVGNGFGNGPAATVSITVSGMIWFINNTAAAGDGRLTSPFHTLAAFQAVNNGVGNNPAAGDNIFIYTGSGSYTGGVTLLNNQKLIGDGSSSTLAAVTGITLALGSDALPTFSGTDPTIENSGGNGITLASGNTIRGLTVGNAPSGFGYSGGAVGTFNIQEASKTGTGGALNISTSGTVGTVQFDNLSSSSAPSQAINLVSVTGTISVTAGSITNPTGTAVNVSGGSVSMTYPGNITQGNNASTVSVSNGHSGTLTFQTGTISVTNGNGLQFDNADGTYNFNGTTTLNGGDAGIDILNGSTGSFTFGTGTSITRANSVSGEAFNLSSSDANVTYSGSMTLGTSTGNMVAINNHDAGTITFNTGNLTKGSSTTQGISIQNSNGGSINFNNPTISITMTSGNAVSLTNNTGGTINFTPAGGGNGIDLTTTSGIGFNATGGGTVSVTGSGNTISSTTGTALNVANTTIGASNLNFQSISSSGGSATGIILDNTGTSGGLIVNGDGSNTTQGGNSSGGTIANKTGTDGSKTTGCGIYLNNTQNVTLRRMTINGTNENFGVYGSNVTNFVMEYCTVSGTNGTSTPNREGSLIFDNMFGTNAVTSSIISGAIEDNVRVENTTGTLTAFNLTNSTIQNNSTVSGNIGFRFATATTGVSMTGTVSNCTFQGNRTDAINVDASNGTMNITVSNNTIIRGTGGNNDGNIGINVTAANAGQVTYSVTGNKVGTPDGSTNASLLNTGINIFAGGSTCTMTGSVTSNAVINRGAGASGFGISVFSNGSASPGSTTITADVSNNTVSNVGLDFGIKAEASGTSFSSTLKLKLTNNNVSVLSSALDCIRVQARNTSTVCARISGNTTNSGGTGFVGLFVRQADTATFNLEGLALGAQTAATTQTYVGSQNPTAATVGAFATTNFTGVVANFCGSIP